MHLKWTDVELFKIVFNILTNNYKTYNAFTQWSGEARSESNSSTITGLNGGGAVVCAVDLGGEIRLYEFSRDGSLNIVLDMGHSYGCDVKAVKNKFQYFLVYSIQKMPSNIFGTLCAENITSGLGIS